MALWYDFPGSSSTSTLVLAYSVVIGDLPLPSLITHHPPGTTTISALKQLSLGIWGFWRSELRGAEKKEKENSVDCLNLRLLSSLLVIGSGFLDYSPQHGSLCLAVCAALTHTCPGPPPGHHTIITDSTQATISPTWIYPEARECSEVLKATTCPRNGISLHSQYLPRQVVPLQMPSPNTLQSVCLEPQPWILAQRNPTCAGLTSVSALLTPLEHHVYLGNMDDRMCPQRTLTGTIKTGMTAQV